MKESAKNLIAGIWIIGIVVFMNFIVDAIED